MNTISLNALDREGQESKGDAFHAMAIVNEHYAERSFSTRQFQRTRNSIYFLRCTQFSTTQVPLFMQSVEKPRSLLVVSRVECVTARHYFIRSCVKQRRWKFLTRLQNNILSNIIRLTLRICRFKKLYASRSIENRGSIGSIWSMEVHGEQFRRQWI